MYLRYRPSVGLGWDVEIDFHALDARPLNMSDPDGHAIEAKCLGQSFNPPTIEPVVDQCADEHVASDSAGRIEDRDFHYR